VVLESSRFAIGAASFPLAPSGEIIFDPSRRRCGVKVRVKGDPTKFLPNKQITHSGITASCDTWIDQAQTAPNELAGVTLNANFNAATATAGVKNYLTGWGERKGCCSDGKSAAFKDHKYFCKDPTDWLPDKTYSGPEMSNSETSCKDWVEVDVDIKDEDFTQSWSCDGKSETIKQDVQILGADVMGCCGSTKQSAYPPYSMSAAASSQHVGVIALAAAVAVFLA
jgi:hypothetical protein